MNRRPEIFSDLPPFPRFLPQWNHATILVLGLALLVRTCTGVALSDKLKADPDAYAKLAENLKNYGVLGSVGLVQDPDDPTAQPKRVTRPQAYRPPLYPVLLRLTCIHRGKVSPTRVIILHVLMGAVTTLIVWQIALRCGLGAWSMIAAMATLFDPILINQASLVMTETLATLLVAAALWALMHRAKYLQRKYAGDNPLAVPNEPESAENDRESDDQEVEGEEAPIDTDSMDDEAAETTSGVRKKSTDASLLAIQRRRTRLSPHARLRQRLENHWLPWMRFDLLAGFLLGLAVLCRPTFLAWIGLLLVVEIVRSLYNDRFQAILHSVALAMMVGVVVSPWMIRNANVIGKATPTTTHGGYTLLLGNNPDFYRFLNRSGPGATWDPSQLDADRREFIRRNKLTEVEADQDSYGRAFEAISNDRRTFVYSCLVRLGRFWAPMPHKGAVQLPDADELPEPPTDGSAAGDDKGSRAGDATSGRSPPADSVADANPRTKAGGGKTDDARTHNADMPRVETKRPDTTSAATASPDAPTPMDAGEDPARSLADVDAGAPDESARGEVQIAPPYVESTREKVLRWITCAWYDMIMVLVLVGITVVVRRKLSGPWLEGLLLVIALSAVHTFYWSNMRMRAPLTPFLSLLVAAGVTLVCSREDELEPLVSVTASTDAE